MTFMESQTPLGIISKEVVRINVGGGIFEVYRSTLERFPDTLLGNKKKLSEYWNPELRCYFLERHKLIFSSILYFYQSDGLFYRPTCISQDQFQTELEFFQLKSEYDAYSQKVQSAIAKKTVYTHEDTQSLKCRVWNFFKDPKSSVAAQVWAIADVIAISIAVLIFIVETMPVVQKELKNPNRITETMFFSAETVCIIFFTAELVGRFLSCPNKVEFSKNLMNWIDFVTILPYFVQLITDSADKTVETDTNELGVTKAKNHDTQAIVILRILRVVRILKLARHSKGIIIVTKTLTSSINELALLLFFWFIGVIIFGSIMYYVEVSAGAKNTDFKSILHSSWWAVVTMSTVGYGDMVPQSAIGKLIASVCMMFSMIIIALPVTVIVSKFTRVYAKYKDKI